jgi:hypothetical protein
MGDGSVLTHYKLLEMKPDIKRDEFLSKKIELFCVNELSIKY